MLNLFNSWTSEEIKTANDLATQTGAEEMLISTLLLFECPPILRNSFPSFLQYKVSDLNTVINCSPNHESSRGHSRFRGESRKHIWA